MSFANPKPSPRTRASGGFGRLSPIQRSSEASGPSFSSASTNGWRGAPGRAGWSDWGGRRRAAADAVSDAAWCGCSWQPMQPFTSPGWSVDQLRIVWSAQPSLSTSWK